MLSMSSASIVRATLPLVRTHAEAVTAKFYTRMFEAHPQLLELFNRGNQANGQQRQVLAGAVVAYAEHLTATSTLPWAATLDRIAHKHASLGIAPAQYTIVGKHLLDAVADVLGSAVTPEVAAAWEETYWLLACELVAREARLYHAVGVADPNAIWRQWRVLDRIAETSEVVSFTLFPADAGPVPSFTPGQYVSVAVELDGGRGQQIRQYSLSGRPGADTWQITVKRILGTDPSRDGMVSAYLHDQVAIGDLIRLSPPFGEVSAVAGDGPLLLISAGIGLTPAMSALEHLAAATPQRPVVLVHADRAGHTHALRQHLPRLCDHLSNLRLNLWYENDDADGNALPAMGARISAGRVDPDQIPLSPEANVHLCGPLPFMRQVRSGLLRRGVPADRIAYEVFGPDMLRVGNG